MADFCYSCGMALMGPEGEKARGNCCQHCSSNQGALLPKEQIQKGIAEWFSGWAPKGGSIDFMKAMPAWSEEQAR